MYNKVSDQFPLTKRKPLTVDTGVVGFHKSLLDLAILDQQSVPLAAVVTKDGGALEAQIQGLGELAARVTQEAYLASTSVSNPFHPSRDYIHHSCLLGLGM